MAIVLFLMPSLTFAQAPNLGTAANFVLFSSVGALTNSSPSLLTGNVGSNSGSSTGFGNVNGVMDNNNGASAAASADLLSAYNQLNSTIPNFFPAPLLGNGDTLVPGVYKIAAAATMNGNLILNAQGNPNAVFIFQINGSFATGANAKVILINGGLACNVFWKIEGLVSMASGTTMRGTVIANNAGIVMNTNDTLEGRALSTTGAVSVGGIQAYTPVGCGSPLLTGPAAPALGSTACYGLFSGNGPVSNAGVTHVTGDVGTNVGLTTGFNPLFVSGMIHPIPDGSTAACAADLLNAYTYLNTLPADIELLYPAQFGNNLVLTPHTYVMNSATTFTGTVYLNGAGDSNAVFVMQLNGALTTSTYSNVILTNGTQAKNVFWKVEGAVQINDYSVFNGTIVCNNGAISLNTGVSLNGRALTTTGALGAAAITVIMPPGCTGTCNTPGIIGTPIVCTGLTTTLTDTAGGGAWSSNNSAVATVGTGNGIVTGMTAGTATITYMPSGGCFATIVVTVNSNSAGTITGASTVTAGSNITLTDLTSGGTWSSSNSNASVSGGIVTGVTAGTVTISYAVSGSCATTYATKLITVNNSSIPGINGNTSICAGGTSMLTDAATGGTWNMSSVVATVGMTSGIVTASASYTGTATVTYTSFGASTTIVITVNAKPSAIQAAASECAGATVTLTDVTAGGVWSGTGASISGTGTTGMLIAGSSAGVASITYMLTTGCYVTTSNTIYANPLPITGMFNVCTGGITILTDVSVGSNWSSSNTAVAIASGADITGAGVGTATITFKSSAAGSCIATQVITVSAQPTAIAGNTGAICQGATLSLTDGAGLWSSSNMATATIGSASGIVTGLTGGTTTITYTTAGSAGCVAKTIVTVSATPTVTGTATICIGGTTVLHDAVAGGTWMSGSTGIAVVSATGIVTGMATGSTTITYTTAAGCTGMEMITVSGASATISGNLFICNGTTTTLTDASAGGTWSMSSAIASVAGSTGVVTASNSLAGTATVSYTAGSCVATAIVTVSAKPAAISGATYECAGMTITLADATAGGVWSGAGDATITGTGSSATLVANAIGGTATVTYTIPSGCMATSINTIYANPLPIQGNFNMCVGAVTDLSTASSAGGWTSSNTTIAIASGADITGEGVGTATITFKSTTAGMCMVTQVITVNAMPIITAINGPTSISHAGGAVTISDATSGGIWTSSNTSVIVLSGSTGTLINATALTTTGSSVITYAVTTAGCTAKAMKTFGAAAAGHAGTITLFAGATVNIPDEGQIGIWSSSDNNIATVDENGVVMGIMPGNVRIMHEMTSNDGAQRSNTSNVIVTAIPASISLMPNPNKGIFTVKGTVGSVANEEVTLEVSDMLGQVIYRNKVMALGGNLNEVITVSNGFANGMYILNVQSGTENMTFHFVIQ